MKERYHRWYSNQLNCEMKMLEFGERGFPLVLFPTSMGRFYENKDFGLIDSVAWYINEGLIRIFCPDSIDHLSWYNRSVHPAERVQNHIWYDKMLVHELYPFVKRETGFSKIALGGCSFGGYHAVNSGFKHPEDVKYIISMGAKFDIKSQLDGYYDDNVYFNNPPDFIPNASNPHLNELQVILGTGNHDICLDDNIRFADILRIKGQRHWLDIRGDSNHDWSAWKGMLNHYLPLIN